MSEHAVKDKRKMPRHDVRLLAYVQRPNEHDRLPCYVRDVSMEGALVEANYVALPEKFYLVINWQGEIRRWCRVQWRSGFTVGVLFITDPADLPQP